MALAASHHPCVGDAKRYAMGRLDIPAPTPHAYSRSIGSSFALRGYTSRAGLMGQPYRQVHTHKKHGRSESDKHDACSSAGTSEVSRTKNYPPANKKKAHPHAKKTAQRRRNDIPVYISNKRTKRREHQREGLKHKKTIRARQPWRTLDTSVPAIPMAIPIAACCKAGASFTPSPVMAGTWKAHDARRSQKGAITRWR